MPKRILDVGNCSADHSTISSLVRSEYGAEVVQAHDGQEALQLLKSGNFDLVTVNRLMDRDGAEGLEIIQAIKADAEISDVPVMLITNYANHQRLAVSAGAVDGFGKSTLHSRETLEKLRPYLS